MKKTKYEVISSEEQFLNALSFCEKEKFLGVDTETSGLDPYVDKVLLIQLATADRVFIVPARLLDNSVNSLGGLKSLLERRTSTKVLHNAAFDYRHLKHSFGIKMNGMADTGLAEAILTAGLASSYNQEEEVKMSSLSELTEKYFGTKLDKEIRKEFISHNGNIFTSAQLEYAAEDAFLTRKVFITQLAKLKEKGLMSIFRLECNAIRAISEIEDYGCLINIPRWKKILKLEKMEAAALEKEILKDMAPILNQGTLFGESPRLNISSTQQLTMALNLLGVDVEDTREITLKFLTSPLVTKILAYREHQKCITAFGDKILDKVNKTTGKLHPRINQLGAPATGRMSYQKPNLQQIKASITYYKIMDKVPDGASFLEEYTEPITATYNDTEIKLVKKMAYEGASAYVDTKGNVYLAFSYRDLFIAEPGKKIVTADYSQMELRIIAELSQDEAFVKAFNEGRDIHEETMMRVFKKKSKENRLKAKTIGFGVSYGLSWKGLAQRFNLEENEAKKIINSYFETYPKVKDFLELSGKKALYDKYSESLAGRKRFYPDIQTSLYSKEEVNSIAMSIERKGKNMPIQSLNADITKLALSYVQDWIDTLPEGMVNILLVVHDEIVLTTVDSFVKEAAEKLEEFMIAAGREYIKTVPVEVDVSIGTRWSK